MTLAEILSYTRTILDDEVPDFRVSDSRLVFWLSEGQDQFCKETGFFTDKATFNVVTVEGVDDYAINSRILEIKNIYNPDGAELKQFQMSDQIPTVSENGTPIMWQADEASGRVRLYPTPDTSGAVYMLRVWRMPKIQLTHTDVDGDYDTDPELRSDFVGACAEWAVFRALSIHDMEVEDSNKAAAHMALFKWYTEMGRTAFTRLAGAKSYIGPSPEYVV